MARKLARRRERLHQRDPRCYLCKIVTILPKVLASMTGVPPEKLVKFLPPDLLHKMATIDHEFVRYDPRRRIPEKNGIERTFLCCYKCNAKRGEDDYLSLDVEVRRIASEGRGAWTLGDIAKIAPKDLPGGENVGEQARPN